MRVSLGGLVARNWPIKLAAVFFAIMLYIAVAAQQPLTQSFPLQPSDVELPKGTEVQVAEITPREIDVLLDSVASKDVKIVPLVRVEAESGYVLRGLSLVPSVARLVGPEKSLAGVDSVSTVPVAVSAVAGPFFRTVPVDTSLLGVVHVSPQEVRVAGEVT